MDVHEIRYANLVSAKDRFVIVRGLRDFGSIQAFADELDMSARFLGHLLNKRKPIGGRAAREIEVALGLPHGQLDRMPSFEDKTGKLSSEESVFLLRALTMFRKSQPSLQLAISELLLLLTSFDSDSAGNTGKKMRVVSTKRRTKVMKRN